MSVKGITYLERKIRAIEHIMPRVILCRGKIKAKSLARGKYSDALGKPIRGFVKETIQSEFTPYPSQWNTGRWISGQAIIGMRYSFLGDEAVGVPIANQNVRLSAKPHGKASLGDGKPIKSFSKAVSKHHGKIALAEQKALRGALKLNGSTPARATISTQTPRQVQSTILGSCGCRLSYFSSFTYARGQSRFTTTVSALLMSSTQRSLPSNASLDLNASATLKSTTAADMRSIGAVKTRASGCLTKARRLTMADEIGHSFVEEKGKTFADVLIEV